MGPRRAYICAEKHPPIRVFLGPKDKVPNCSSCGRKMVRQPNNLYFGRKV